MAKKNKKGIIIGAVAACAVIGALAPDKKVESIELSLPAYQTEYDINTEVPIDISILPDDADADAIEYVASSESISFSDSKLNTGDVEGTYEIYAVSNDVKSNILSIDVVDITAREEAEAKAEEERLAKEAAEKKAAEEKAAREAEEQKAAEEKAAREAAEQKAAEEKAKEELAATEKTEREPKNNKAESPKLLDAQAEKTASPDVSAENTPAPPVSTASAEPDVVEATPAPAETPSTPVGDMVWLSATGEKYHRINNCGRMNPDKARQVTLDAARNGGYEQCSKCW